MQTTSSSSPSSASHWFRQAHRWVSVIFTVAVTANFVAMTQGQPPAWITYSPLLPLALLWLSGLYLFLLPYVRRWRSGRGQQARVGSSARSTS